jgi:hypothetical protein
MHMVMEWAADPMQDLVHSRCFHGPTDFPRLVQVVAGFPMVAAEAVFLAAAEPFDDGGS